MKREEHPLIEHALTGFSIVSNTEKPLSEAIGELNTTIADEYKAANELTQKRTERKKAVAKRLKYLREESGLKQKDVSKKTGINITTLSGYELGRNEPHLEALVRLANLYEISLDYLLCRTDEKGSNQETKEDWSKKITILEHEIQSLKDKIK